MEEPCTDIEIEVVTENQVDDILILVWLVLVKYVMKVLIVVLN